MPNDAEPLPLFVHGAVDDYGFSLAEFRVLCAIARRGECYEGVPRLARRCRINRDTAWAALKVLTACGCIQRQARFGRTTLLRLNPLSQWRPGGKGGSAGKRGRRATEMRGWVPGGNKGPQSISPKLLPIRKPRDYSQGF